MATIILNIIHFYPAKAGASAKAKALHAIDPTANYRVIKTRGGYFVANAVAEPNETAPLGSSQAQVTA